MDEETSKLFPEIDPNINETLERQKAIDGENVIVEDKLEHIDKKSTQKDMFLKKRISKKESGEKNVKFEVDEIEKNEKITSPKKDKYAHLAKARQKGIETRRRKAEERRLKKAEEKAKKEEARRLKREATMERNRQKAKERYYKQKAQKKTDKQEVMEHIVSDTKPKGTKQMMKMAQNANMDFNTFAKYMMKYEQMKEAYNDHKKKKKEEKSKKAEKEALKTKPSPSFNSPNYPLAHLYNPSFRNTNQYF